MLTISKAFVSLLAAASVVAGAPSRRQLAGQATCTYLFTPSTTVDSNTANLLAEFNYVIGRTLATYFSGSEIDGPGASWDDNGDNTFTVEDTRSVAGKSASATAAALESFEGTTATGYIDNASITWTFSSVSCVF